MFQRAETPKKLGQLILLAFILSTSVVSLTKIVSFISAHNQKTEPPEVNTSPTNSVPSPEPTPTSFSTTYPTIEPTPTIIVPTEPTKSQPITVPPRRQHEDND